MNHEPIWVDGIPMPTLALRGLTIFPHVLIHFDVGRDASIQALEAAMDSGCPIFLVSQRQLDVEAPLRKDLHNIGTICHIRQLLRTPGDNVRVMVEGICRGRLVELTQTEPYLAATIEEITEVTPTRATATTEALMRSTYEMFQQYAELAPKISPDLLMNVSSSENPGYIADFIAQNIVMRNSDKQIVLEELRPTKRLERLYSLLCREVEILVLDMDIQMRTRDQMNDHQRDYYLREQMKVIQSELGEDDSEFAQYQEKIEKGKYPKEVEEKLAKELNRLNKQPFGSSEASVIRNYLDVVLELPWEKPTKERVSVSHAKKILDDDHFGLDKVKERILEYLAVRQLSPQVKGQVLCLVGPPGVGKTSIAMSVARALNRKLGRISLGGVSDEAEIRGHRKTYVGAMPGRLMTAINQAGSNNPVLLLDEIDKLGRDHRGDPSAALLEVLDGEQNHSFRDHFVELPFDLSDALFICTANTTSTIPKPLLDRMEMIELGSYTDEEKVQIAKKHLLSKERKRHGLKSTQIKITDNAIRAVISGYTRESGVRRLERQLATLCRKTAMRLVSEDVKSVSITEKNLADLLGPVRYRPESGVLESRIGVVNGLAWTSVGGELLEVEVNVVEGSGKLVLTGNLGNVMKESAQAALSYIRSRAARLGVDGNFYKEKDIHIHFPEGAVPKDGPSAGIAITTALVSALTDTPIRPALAMTGEISLRGRVMAIGGLKEKSMAAYKNGVKTVLIPLDNQKDLEEIDQTVRRGLTVIPVSHADQVLAAALVPTEGVHIQETPDITVAEPLKSRPQLRQ